MFGAAGALLIGIAGCSSDPAPSPSSTTTNAPDSYRGVVLGPLGQGQVVIGVGDENHRQPPLLTTTTGDQVTAQCEGPRGAPRTITVSTQDGWTITLNHGSQTITARNPVTSFGPAAITTDPFTIELDEQDNEARLRDTGHSTIYTSGVNWDKPAAGHAEVDITTDAPAEWGTTDRFTMRAHLNCGGDPQIDVGGMVTR